MKQNKSAPWIAVAAFNIFMFFTSLIFGNTMVCTGIVNVSPGNDCVATLDALTALDEDATTCTGPFLLIVQTTSGDPIAMTSTTVDLPVFDFLNDTLVLVVVDQPTGNACSSIALITDDQDPVITCPTDTVTCVAPLHPDSLKQVVVDDNCLDGIILSFEDDTIGPNCMNITPFVYAVVRNWTVTDAGNNSASCNQVILIERADLADVEFPADLTLDCSAVPDTAVTGRPTIDGEPIEHGGLCNIHISFQDQTNATCGGSVQILRTWTALNTCTGTLSTDTQIISLFDVTVPLITCQDTITVSTDIGKCSATVDLAVPPTTDDCSSVTVEAEITGQGTGFHYDNLPKGQYEVTFTATDACNNFSTCKSVLKVIDDETPSAVCEGIKIVSLSSNGVAPLMAIDFDDGSSDNCPQILDFKVSRNNANFGPNITFNCADALVDSVTVYLKVTETLNPNSMNVCTTKVVVRDKIFPIITCPLPATVDCDADLSNLSIFGSPFVFDGCTATVTESNVFNLNNCGAGTISRTFTATDPSGNASSCTQTITVLNQTPFNGSTIQWPEDYTETNTCPQPSDLEPVDLPTAPINYSKPVVTGANCAMIATSYTDQLFYVAFPACYKIVRTWKVMDWCQYSTANPTVGLWTHQQIIAVMDSEPPVITFCPPDLTVSVGNDCNMAQVNLMPVTATDCSPNLNYTNTSPYNGANASGNYPQGIHNVTFTVKDGCGNKSTCTTKITVTDLKKPTPYCNTGIVAELQAMGGQIMATVQATQFNNNSFDNCTPKPQLQFSIRLLGNVAPATSSLTFDCSGEGEHQVEVWVTDAAGNSDYCITNVIIQDNMNLCPDILVSGDIMVAGEIKTEEGEKMPAVKVSLPNTGMEDETSNSGTFAIAGLQQGGSYTIAPEKNTGHLNGVTTFDLVLMSRHVLGISPLTSPYKLIAADINKSGSVTTTDMVELRKLILQIYHEFPNNKSWRFVAKDYVFPNPANPFSQPFPEAMTLNNINQDLLDANFVGIKIGDLNCSATTNFNDDDIGDRSGMEDLVILTDDRMVEAGEEVVLPFRLKNRQDLLALQFTLEFETDYLELQGIEEGALPAAAEESFGQSLLEEGILTAAWYQNQPLSVDADDALFSLRFKVKRAGRLSEMLAMSSRYTEAVAYNSDEFSLNPNLAFANQNNMLSNSFQLYQNQPNPFKKSTSIGFNLPEPGWARLTIYDLSGKVLKSYDRQYSEGYNRVTIEREELPSGGVLFYQLETSDNRATKKMVLLQ